MGEFLGDKDYLNGRWVSYMFRSSQPREQMDTHEPKTMQWMHNPPPAVDYVLFREVNVCGGGIYLIVHHIMKARKIEYCLGNAYIWI
jgi:hypothetical protein